ncbi:hypothetical protein CLOM_g24488, partial [Closterium sp. NIES-68]
LKGVKSVAGGHYVVTKLRVDNIRSGGTQPQVHALSSCLEGAFKEWEVNFPWQSIAGNRGHLANRYSFIMAMVYGPETMIAVWTAVQASVSALGNRLYVVSHPYNNYTLCGKLKRKHLGLRN